MSLSQKKMKPTVEDVYTPEDLAHLQKIEMEIYLKFREICMKHNFKFFAMYGTMLGAVREQGMIPWDDDIDIGMPRKDYEKMLKIIEKEMGDEYELMNADISLEYPFVTSRIMKKNTEFRTLSMKNCKCQLGIFLDLFCIDNMPNKAIARNWFLMKCWILEKMYILRCLPFPNLPYTGIKRYLVYSICGIAYPFMKLFPRKLLRNLWKATAKKYRNQKTLYLGNCFGLKSYKNIWKRKDVFPLIEVPFGETSIFIPKEYDKILTVQFGDYMTPLPKGKRSYIIPYKLDFGEKYKKSNE